MNPEVYGQRKVFPATESALAEIPLPAGSVQDDRGLTKTTARLIAESHTQKYGLSVTDLQVFEVPAGSNTHILVSLNSNHWLVSREEGDSRDARFWLKRGDDYRFVQYSQGGTSDLLIIAVVPSAPEIAFQEVPPEPASVGQAGQQTEGTQEPGPDASTQGSQESNANSDIRQAAIPGWTERRQGEYLILSPENPVPGYPIEVTVFPVIERRELGEAISLQVWESVTAQFGAALTMQVNGKPFMDDGVEPLFGDRQLMHCRGAIRTGGRDFLMDLFLVDYQQRIVPVIVLAPEIVEQIYRYQPFGLPVYNYPIWHFITHLMPGEEGLLPSQSGRLDGASALGSVWAGLGMQGGLIKGSALMFFDNGQVFYGGYFPAEGLHDRDTQTLQAQTPRYWGHYTFNGQAGVLSMPYGDMAFRLSGDRLVLTSNQTEHAFIRLNPVDGAVFEGTYVLRGNDPSLRLHFRPDHGFTDEGVVKVLEHATTYPSIAAAGGTGTYTCLENTIIFTYTDGREVRIAFPGLFFKPEERSPGSIILSFNHDELTRLR